MLTSLLPPPSLAVPPAPAIGLLVIYICVCVCIHLAQRSCTCMLHALECTTIVATVKRSIYQEVGAGPPLSLQQRTHGSRPFEQYTS